MTVSSNAPVHLVGLTGYARSGKDTVAQILVDDFGFKRVAFADALKNFAYDANPIIMLHQGKDVVRLKELVQGLGWEEAKGIPEVRETLQRFGVAARDNISSDAWVHAAFRDVRPGVRVVISDVRFPNEADAIRARNGVTWRISRPGTEAINTHVSETALDSHVPDIRIRNNGSIEDLRNRVAFQAMNHGW